VNFYLRVVGRRLDGYHLLESVMAPVSLFDRISLRRNTSGRIRLRCNRPELANDANLAARAACLLRDEARSSAGVDIRLRKRIPAGAGLGGGSSDAAAVLLGLNRLWRLRLPRPRLATLALRLGADVPFFLHRSSAIVRGIGERVEPCPSFPAVSLVLVYPGFPVDTAWVFRNLRWRKPRRAPQSPITGFLRGLLPLTHLLHNDLEAVAAAAHQEIHTLERKLVDLGAAAARMTGSGSAVFGLFGAPNAARRAATALRRQGLWAVPVRALPRVPLALAKPG